MCKINWELFGRGEAKATTFQGYALLLPLFELQTSQLKGI